MLSASAPPPPAYDACTPDQWDTWYKCIGELGEGGTDFGLLETVGQELRAMKVPFAEGWGDTLGRDENEGVPTPTAGDDKHARGQVRWRQEESRAKDAKGAAQRPPPSQSKTLVSRSH